MRIALPRRARTQSPPITPLVDILLILLIFFMVTSTYFDLAMIPLVEPAVLPDQQSAAPTSALDGGAVRPLLVRLDPAGAAVVHGEQATAPELERAVRNHLAAGPSAPVVVLPSPQASLQALVDLLEAIRAAGAREISLLRIGEATR